MSFPTLRKALSLMNPTGEDGFEGLVATLLSNLTGDRYFVARSGDQPADAVSRGVAMQAKRYGSTAFDESKFEGEFSRACRVHPELDVYVLAATRETAQLHLLCDELAERSGVDIVRLGLGTKEPALKALCVTYWAEASSFLPAKLRSALARWAKREAARKETASVMRQIHADVTQHVRTAENLRRLLDAQRARRFGLVPGAPYGSRFEISLPNFVGREGAQSALAAWWSDGTSRAAMIEAEEGMGKSWVAAAFAEHAAQEFGALVLWLDSADWARHTTLAGVVANGLKFAGIDDDRTSARLVRKALRAWANRLLIVLDGVNERGAKTLAHHLLGEQQARMGPVCRLLFTNRPTSWPSDERALWKNVRKITLDRFTEAELQEALRRLKLPVPRAEIPEGLVATASIPRYFRRAIALRDRFGSLRNISKEMVLWADLLAKIEANDPQVTGAMDFASPAEARRALEKLAEGAKALQSAVPASAGYDLLIHVFGEKFSAVRHDLAEQRIVLDPVGDNPRPSPEHIRLGFALHFGQVLQRHADQGVEALAQLLRAASEPVLSQDDVTEALFVALQLSALGNASVVLSSHQRAALLLAWSTAHNSRVELTRLRFWAKEDLSAYLDFMEAGFVTAVSESWMLSLMTPLAEIWREHPDPASLLGERLCRWLKLVWFEKLASSSPGLVSGGHAFPLARHRVQLDLGNVATSILSWAPVPGVMLRELVLAWASVHVSMEELDLPASAAASAERILVSSKDIHRNLGPLFRWTVTEAGRPLVREMRDEHTEDELVRQACDEILSSFDVFGRQPSHTPENVLREGKSFFEEGGNRWVNCAHLAVRDDHPGLSAGDQAVIAGVIEQAFASPELESGPWMTGADSDVRRYLAWFARYQPQRLRELGSQFRLTAFQREEAWLALDQANVLPWDPTIVSSRELLAAAKNLALREIGGEPRRSHLSLTEAHVLAVTCFDDPDLAEWFEFTAQHALLQRESHIYPVPWLIPLRCSSAIGNSALARALTILQLGTTELEKHESEFEFWAIVAGSTCDANTAASRLIGDVLASFPAGSKGRFYRLLLYFRTLSNADLEAAFANGELFRLLDWEGWRALRTARQKMPAWEQLPLEFDRLIERAAPDVCGMIFVHAGQTEMLRRWGRLIFAKAFDLLGERPPSREFWGPTIHSVDRTGVVVELNCGERDDRKALPSERFRLSPKSSRVPRETLEAIDERLNAAIKVWQRDLERLEESPASVLHEFGSFVALAEFQKLEPEAFESLARRFLDLARAKPGESHHLGTFALCVACALMPLDPDHAIAAYRELKDGPLRREVLNEYKISICEAALWKAAGLGDSRCQELCLSVLKSAGTDTDLMNHSITAQAEGAGAFLRILCDRLLAEPLAKDRCLGVSLLPWMATPEAAVRLATIASSDPSGWCRAHAEWAHEVAQQELSVRRHYRRILTQTDASDAKAMLEVLRPALTESAHWWKHGLEEEAAASRPIPFEVRAALVIFWHGIESTTRNDFELFGRKTKEYLRGEKITDFRAPGLRLNA